MLWFLNFLGFLEILNFLDLLKFYVLLILLFFLVPWFFVFWICVLWCCGFWKDLNYLAYNFDMSDRSGIWDIYLKKHVQFYRNILCIFDLSSAVFYIIFPKKDACWNETDLNYIICAEKFGNQSIFPRNLIKQKTAVFQNKSNVIWWNMNYRKFENMKLCQIHF